MRPGALRIDASTACAIELACPSPVIDVAPASAWDAGPLHALLPLRAALEETTRGIRPVTAFELAQIAKAAARIPRRAVVPAEGTREALCASCAVGIRCAKILRGAIAGETAVALVGSPLERARDVAGGTAVVTRNALPFHAPFGASDTILICRAARARAA